MEDFIDLSSVLDEEDEKIVVDPNTFVTLPILRGFKEIEKVWEWINHDEVVICGGYARYCASTRDKPVRAGDLDLFPKTEDASGKLIELFLSKGFEKIHENEMSFTFKKHKVYTDIPVIQVIKPVDEGAIKTVGTLEEILSNFDFTVTRIAITSPTTCLADVEFDHDEAWKLIRLKNIHCPISSMIRCMKYGRKGYHIRPAETIKLFADWDSRDASYRNRMYELFTSSKMGDISQEEIDSLERLLRID